MKLYVAEGRRGRLEVALGPPTIRLPHLFEGRSGHSVVIDLLVHAAVPPDRESELF